MKPFRIQLSLEADETFPTIPQPYRQLAQEKLNSIARSGGRAFKAAPGERRIILFDVGSWRCVCELEVDARALTLCAVRRIDTPAQPAFGEAAFHAAP